MSSLRTSVEHRFVKGDPVARYWLAHCEGFAVERANGRPAGTVDEVVLDAEAEGAATLVLRRGRNGRRLTTIEADAVEAAVPARSTLVLAAPARRRPVARAVALARLAAPRAGRPALRAGVLARGGVRGTAAGVRVHVVSLALRGARLGERFAWAVQAIALHAWRRGRPVAAAAVALLAAGSVAAVRIGAQFVRAAAAALTLLRSQAAAAAVRVLDRERARPAGGQQQPPG